jgi:hypothetical protein
MVNREGRGRSTNCSDQGVSYDYSLYPNPCRSYVYVCNIFRIAPFKAGLRARNRRIFLAYVTLPNSIYTDPIDQGVSPSSLTFTLTTSHLPYFPRQLSHPTPSSQTLSFKSPFTNYHICPSFSTNPLSQPHSFTPPYNSHSIQDG